MRSSEVAWQHWSLAVAKVREYQLEISLFSGMIASTCLITGAAMTVLVNPNVGQQLTPVSLLKPGSLPEGGFSAVGKAIRGFRGPLKIEIVQGGGANLEPSAHPLATIVAPAEFQPQLAEAMTERNTQLLTYALGAAGAMLVLGRLAPHLPVWPKRRQPLGERLASVPVEVLPAHPLAVKLAVKPEPVNVARNRIRRIVPMSALYPEAQGVTALSLLPDRSALRPTNRPTGWAAPTNGLGFAPGGAMLPAQQQTSQPASLQTSQPVSQPVSQNRPRNLAKNSARKPAQTHVQTPVPNLAQPPSLTEAAIAPPSTGLPDWLVSLDVRQQQPLTSLL